MHCIALHCIEWNGIISSYLVITADGTQIQYRKCTVKNMRTPTSRMEGDEHIELAQQMVSAWKIKGNVKKIFSTPMKTEKGMQVVQYVIEDTDGTEWLVFSKNFIDSKAGYSPMVRSKGLHFHAGEVVCETAWQQLEEGEKPLCAIRTNQVSEFCVVGKGSWVESVNGGPGLQHHRSASRCSADWRYRSSDHLHAVAGLHHRLLLLG